MFETVAANNSSSDERAAKTEIRPARARHEHAAAIEVKPVRLAIPERDQLACLPPQPKSVERGKHV